MTDTAAEWPLVTSPIGTAVVVFDEPAVPGTERDFNRYYEDDHFYVPAMSGPGCMAGARWVAPKACKDARAPGTLFGDRSRGSYLLTFWILDGAQEAWDAWLQDQEQLLIPQRRWGFPQNHIFTAVYHYLWGTNLEAGPRPIVALDRRFAGLVALAVRVPEPIGADERDAGSGEVATTLRAWAETMTTPSTPIWVGLEPFRLQKSVVPDAESLVGRFVLLLGFCEEDPLGTFARVVEPRLAELGALPGVDGVGFAGPFYPTEPGSDRYVDEL